MDERGTGGALVAPVPGAGRVRLSVAVLSVLATVVLALVAVALVVRLETVALPSAAPRDPPPAPPPASRLTVSGERVSMDELSLTLPGTPYGCGDVAQAPSGLTQLEACTTTVHRNFDGKGSDWLAVLGVGVVDASRVVPGDLEKTTDAVFDDLVALNYSAADHATLSRTERGPADVAAPPGAAYTRSARVAVRRTSLPTPYDKLVVIVIRLQGGQHVAVFSDFPHDGSQRALSAVVASVSSIRAKR